MTTITSPAPDVTAVPTAARGAGAGFVTAAAQSARRTILQFFRTPQLLLMGTVQGALFLFMFRYIFGGAIDPRGGVDYVAFLVPGFLVTTILWIGMASPAGVAEDASSGVHDRLRSLPIPRAAVVVGRSLADTALTGWGMLVAAAVGFAVGFRFDADPGAVLLAAAVTLVATYCFTWVFISIGLFSGSAQAAQGTATLLVIPLAFVSSAYVPVDSLPGWMQPVADNQPLTVISNAVRSLTLGGTDAAGVGHSTAYWVALSLAWCAGILVVFGSFAVYRFARRR
jgi:ABC-2 type transport system permease protein